MRVRQFYARHLPSFWTHWHNHGRRSAIICDSCGQGTCGDQIFWNHCPRQLRRCSECETRGRHWCLACWPLSAARCPLQHPVCWDRDPLTIVGTIMSIGLQLRHVRDLGYMSINQIIPPWSGPDCSFRNMGTAYVEAPSPRWYISPPEDISVEDEGDHDESDE